MANTFRKFEQPRLMVIISRIPFAYKELELKKVIIKFYGKRPSSLFIVFLWAIFWFQSGYSCAEIIKFLQSTRYRLSIFSQINWLGSNWVRLFPAIPLKNDLCGLILDSLVSRSSVELDMINFDLSDKLISSLFTNFIISSCGPTLHFISTFKELSKFTTVRFYGIKSIFEKILSELIVGDFASKHPKNHNFATWLVLDPLIRIQTVWMFHFGDLEKCSIYPKLKIDLTF